MLRDAEAVQRVVRGVVAGADPARLLDEALRGAVAACRGRQGLLLGVVDGTSTPLASTGPVAAVVLEAAEAAVATGRLARRSAPGGAASAVAEPVRVGPRVVGALAVGGDARTLDAAALPLFADCASLALSRRPPATPAAAPAVLEATASLTTYLDRPSVLVRIFDVAESLFGARAGFCALFEDGTVRVAQSRGIGLDRLRSAAAHPEFAALLTAPGLRVDPPDHPVVARLTEGTEWAVGLPLLVEARRIGHLVLLFGEPPDGVQRALLAGFARHVAGALRAAEVYARLGDAEERLAAVAHAVGSPVLVVDATGNLAVVNGAATELFRLAGAFEIGRPVAGRLGHAGLETMLGPQAAPGPARTEVCLGTPPRSWAVLVRPIRSSDGRLLGRVMALEDVTAAREIERAKSGFLAVAGHELRTPVTVVAGYVRTLLGQGAGADPATLGHALEALAAATGRLERVVDDLLAAAALEAGELRVERRETDLAAVAARVAELAGSRVRLRRRGGPQLVPADHDRIERVLAHLVDNALRYSEGCVEVGVEGDDDEAVAWVADAGSGIVSEDLARVFEPFVRLDQVGAGAGLGLYLCRRVVELHGGRIWCESRPGAGSRFAFSLPKEPAPAPEADTPAILLPPAAG